MPPIDFTATSACEMFAHRSLHPAQTKGMRKEYTHVEHEVCDTSMLHPQYCRENRSLLLSATHRLKNEEVPKT